MNFPALLMRLYNAGKCRKEGRLLFLNTLHLLRKDYIDSLVKIML